MLYAQQSFLWGRNVTREEMSQQSVSVSPGTSEYLLKPRVFLNCETSTSQNTEKETRGVDKLPYTGYWKVHAGPPPPLRNQ